MTNHPTKCPADFRGPAEWRDYVRETFPPQERPYALACGRHTMFLRFYKVRKQPFPAKFTTELERIRMLRDPERTAALEELNQRIFADMSTFLAATAPNEEGTVIAPTPRETVTELLEYLGDRNSWFMHWVRYSRTKSRPTGTTYEEYVQQNLSEASAEDREFALLMGQIGALLAYFYDHDQELPDSSFQRIWFLHNIKRSERNCQARALVQSLIEAMPSCTSA